MQIVDASQVIVFANQTQFSDADVDAYINNVSKTRNIPTEALSGFSDYMKGALNNMPETVRPNWTAKQTYLALGNLLNAAAELKIDVTPMEGFEPEKFDAILGLEKRGLHSAVVATIGYRHNEDATQHYAKVRKSNEELFINL